MDKTAVGYEEQGLIKLLQDIRDGLSSGNKSNNRPNNDDSDDSDDGDNSDDGEDRKNKEEKYADMPDLETEEDAAKRIADSYEEKKHNYDDIIKKLDKKLKDSKLSNEEKDKLNKELIESNSKLEDFIEIYNDIVKEEKDNIYKKLNKLKNNTEDNINKLEKANECLDKFDNKISILNDKISKIKYVIKNKALTNAEKMNCKIKL